MADLVYVNGVNVPYRDQWEGEAPLFIKMETGTIGIDDLFQQFNEHRIFFPRLIFCPLAKLTHWNVRAELAIIQLLAVLFAFNVWRIMRVTGWTCTGLGFWLFFAANVLIFSPLDWENYLFGFQVGFVLPAACFAACLWIPFATPAPTRFWATLLVCLVCTFSVASGFTSWILTFPLLLHAGREEPWKKYATWWCVWLATFAASLILYFYGYVMPGSSPSLLDAFRHPIQAIQFWLIYLGFPFAYGTTLKYQDIAQISAAAMLSVLVWAVVYIWRRRNDSALVTRCLPWLMMIASGLINAAITTIGRTGFGIGEALTSRYMIFAISLPIGLSFLAATIFQDIRQRTTSDQTLTRTGSSLASLASALALLHVLGWLFFATSWSDIERLHLTAKALVETINLADEPDLLKFYVHANVPPLRDTANKLDQIGFLNPGLIKSNLVSEIAASCPPGQCGAIEQAKQIEGKQDVVVGWAVLPGKKRPADAVLLCYDDAKGQPIIFAVSDVDQPRNDIAQKLSSDSYSEAGWEKTFDSKRLPPGASSITGWAFDAEAVRAYPLDGKVNLK
jgi:hypothetical protein